MSLTMYVRMRRKFSLTSATKVTFVCMFRKRLIFRGASKILFCCRRKMWVHRSKKEERKKGISCSSNLIVHRDECLPFVYKYAYIHTVYTVYAGLKRAYKNTQQQMNVQSGNKFYSRNTYYFTVSMTPWIKKNIVSTQISPRNRSCFRKYVKMSIRGHKGQFRDKGGKGKNLVTL